MADVTTAPQQPHASANGEAAHAAPAAQAEQSFVPFYNDIYKFGLGGVRGDFGPAIRVAACFLFMLAFVAILFFAWLVFTGGGGTV